ncbi:DUF4249 domain-containing protein [Flavobacteriaceae bacterium XHP0103]|uniref:DUF4249 domain-containing protein n=1 Tax=Marixanthotalea marina TaxID=2844359 RepID=UPI002989BB35|nr:DUF4249 domain-containing protein [Marixanthotalea marina]MBU3822654.1 DUF4249 domain-containing protein [Marixanthotalea marina]
MPTKQYLLKGIFLFLFSTLFFTCTNPVSPEYEFIDGLIYIEGFIGTTERSSYVTITESNVAPNYYRNIFVSGASVSFVNENGNKVNLTEGTFEYIPPTDFKGAIGEKWHLEVELPNGKTYLSEVEIINPSVPLKDIGVRYDKQLEYIEDYKKYVPGHEITVTFDDPADQTNNYYWRYKAYDKISICKICYGGVFRNNECREDPEVDYYTYWCDSECWQIDYGKKIHIFSDEFSNGNTTTSLPVATILLTRKTKILVEIQQFSLTQKAFDYYKTIKDLVDNNGGFNAPLPAALIGNMYNPNDANEYVLGRFTAASAFTQTIMVDRTTVEEAPIDTPIRPNPEPTPSGPGPHYTDAPCNESRYRTSIQPEGWIE